MATISKSLTISSEGVYVVELNITPDGATVTPVNDIQTWLHCGEIWDKSYTTISQVISDGATFNALVQNANAVKYMVRSTNWASTVCANSNAMTYIGASDNCSNSLLNDSTWRTAICNSNYFENVLKVKVPTMTGYTTPSGQVVYSYHNPSDGTYPWRAFDGNKNTAANVTVADNIYWFGYKFTSTPKVCKWVFHANATGTPSSMAAFTGYIDVSDDGSLWSNIASVSFTAAQHQAAQSTPYKANISNPSAHKYIRFRSNSSNYSGYSLFTVGYLQFYGR